MRADVETVLEALGIEARPRGTQIEALCPYHDDREAGTWSIARRGRRLGWHHCFSCGESGDLVGLVVHVRGLLVEVPGEDREEARRAARKEARAWIAALGAEAPSEPAPASIHLAVPDATRLGFCFPEEIIFEPVEDWVSPARRYVEERGLAGQVARWGIGYAVDARLAGRVVLAVRDSAGQPANYMARRFSDRGKRYLYPELDERPRLDVMFGEQHWPAPRQRTSVVVTEGAFNALAVERAAGGTVAALGGSDVRAGHLPRLASFPLVVVATDNDAAGNAAAEDIRQALARRCRVVRALPTAKGEGPDIDEMPAEELRALIDGVRG